MLKNIGILIVLFIFLIGCSQEHTNSSDTETVIAERNYCIFGKLFGVRANEAIVPIAPDREVPENTSNPGNLHLNVEHQFGYSWLTWNEIENVASTIATIDEAPGWNLIFSTMRSLASIYGSNNVRLVASFF